MTRLPPSRDEIIKGFPRLGARETGLVEIYPHQYFIDLGSLLGDFENDDHMINRAQEVVSWHRQRTKGRWAWRISDQQVRGDDLLDVRNLLWISFDLPEDAMLSRMTWLDLRGKAECSHLKSA